MEEVFLVYMIFSQLTYACIFPPFIKVEGFLLCYESLSLYNEH